MDRILLSKNRLKYIYNVYITVKSIRGPNKRQKVLSNIDFGYSICNYSAAAFRVFDGNKHIWRISKSLAIFVIWDIAYYGYLWSMSQRRKVTEGKCSRMRWGRLTE